jgi:uncharacterized tellurite resistance protein B-like protein
MIIKRYYIELGKLLFAIAKSDGTVHQKEVLGFKQLITSELLKLEDSTDQFGTDNAFLSEFEFDILLDQNADANDAFGSFIEFAKANKQQLTINMKKIAYNLSEQVANLYCGINKIEGRKLAELKKALEV